MFRRTLLASAAAALAVPVLAPLSPARAQGAAVGNRAAVLARIEAYMNGLTTLRARFLQVAQNGGSAEGTALIWRPGRMRFEYDPPVPLMLVASDGQFLHYDKQLREPSIVPVSSTPLGFLLRPRISLTSGDLEVIGLDRVGGLLRVGMRRKAAPAEGSLTLVFAEDPMELRQWIVVDAQGQQTRVTLTEIQTGVRFDPLVFSFNDPRFFETQVR